MIRLICVAIGYLFGLFQTSYIYGRMKGMDIREHGSGNAGATNALRTLGWKAGLITFLGDCFKCVFAVLLVRFLFDRFYPNENIGVLAGMYAALGVILGHNFPCYLKFHGGKGIATGVGILFGYFWPLALVHLAIFIVLVAITKYVSVGSIITAAVVPLTMYIAFPNMTFASLAIWALLGWTVVWAHRGNIRKLLAGNENKLSFKKSSGDTSK